MRLTGGEGKGRILADAPPGVRPTSGRAKELLFQLIRDRLEGARLLDLFAGTGALGIEALARGARAAVFIEKERRALRTIQDNLRRCHFEDRGKAVPGDVLAVLRQSGRLGGPFDLVLADPPYAAEVFGKVLASVREQGLLAEDGLLMFEAASRTPLAVPEGWNEVDRREVGDTTLWFFEGVASGLQT